MDTSREKIDYLTKCADQAMENVDLDDATKNSDIYIRLAQAYYLSALVRIKVKQNYEDK